MGLIDDIRLKGASDRIAEETLYAEALREVEQGMRRDGLWAKALAGSKMRHEDAQALYLQLRVQSLRDEIDVILHAERERARQVRQQESASNTSRRDAVNLSTPTVSSRPVKGSRDWLNTLIGAAFILGIVIVAANIFNWL